MSKTVIICRCCCASASWLAQRPTQSVLAHPETPVGPITNRKDFERERVMRTVKIDVARMEFKKGGITCLSIDFPGRFDRAIFDAHLIHEMESGTRLSFRFLQREEEELNRAVEDEFRANYQEEYQRACAQAEEKWYPYRDAGIIDDQQEYQYRSGEIDSILKTAGPNYETR